MKYEEVVKSIQDLEDSFKRISVIENLLNDLKGAINAKDLNLISNISLALNSYLPVYISRYENNSNKLSDLIVNSDNPVDLNYEEIVQYLSEEEKMEENI